eukprot:3718713-Pyramimonas_sp.AAC.1
MLAPWQKSKRKVFCSFGSRGALAGRTHRQNTTENDKSVPGTVGTSGGSVLNTAGRRMCGNGY